MNNPDKQQDYQYYDNAVKDDLQNQKHNKRGFYKYKDQSHKGGTCDDKGINMNNEYQNYSQFKGKGQNKKGYNNHSKQNQNEDYGNKNYKKTKKKHDREMETNYQYMQNQMDSNQN